MKKIAILFLSAALVASTVTQTKVTDIFTSKNITWAAVGALSFGALAFLATKSSSKSLYAALAGLILGGSMSHLSAPAKKNNNSSSSSSKPASSGNDAITETFAPKHLVYFKTEDGKEHCIDPAQSQEAIDSFIKDVVEKQKSQLTFHFWKLDGKIWDNIKNLQNQNTRFAIIEYNKIELEKQLATRCSGWDSINDYNVVTFKFALLCCNQPHHIYQLP